MRMDSTNAAGSATMENTRVVFSAISAACITPPPAMSCGSWLSSRKQTKMISPSSMTLRYW